MEVGADCVASPVKDHEGHQWHDPAYVDEWVKREVDDLANHAKHQAERHHIASLVTPLASGPALERGLRFLDLGCGWGGLAAHLLERFPKSTLVAADCSLPMLEKCRVTLEPFPERASFVRVDLDQEGSLRGLADSLDVVVSSRALHHLERQRLGSLYVEIADALSSGGVFLNLDRFLPARRASLATWAAKSRVGSAWVHRCAPKWLHCASGPQQVEMLTAAGFSVEVSRFGKPWIVQGIKR